MIKTQYSKTQAQDRKNSSGPLEAFFSFGTRQLHALNIHHVSFVKYQKNTYRSRLLLFFIF